MTGSRRPSPVRALTDARAAERGGERAMVERQRTRLAALIAHARTRSPFYRELYRGVPAETSELAALPVTGKRELMAAFDDWVTDPAVTLKAARAFTADPAAIGHPFLDRYTLTTTSGTTGHHGIFLQDAHAAAVIPAMLARMLAHWLTVRDAAKIAAGGGRTALVVPEGGHFASTVAAERLRGRSRTAVLSVHRPLAELVEALNAFRPALLAPYATIGALLADEAEAGRLRIDPTLVTLSAEGLPVPEYERISRALGAKVCTSYAANECPFLSYGCRERWLHVNADWAVLEPVDERHRPVPPGEASHTVLLTNLANRVQPILRYDLGDAVTVRPDPCPCGSPGPALRVQGRAADTLAFHGPDGTSVTLAPLPLSTLLEAVPGLELFQIVQTGPARLRLRMRAALGADPDTVWRTAEVRLRELLTRHRLETVQIEHATEAPRYSAGGKVRTIIPTDQI